MTIRTLSGMSTSHLSVGLQNPAHSTFGRRPGSLRRTTHVDMDSERGVLRMDSAARDLFTATDGTTAVLGEAAVRAVVGRKEQRLEEIETVPGDPRATGLIGTPVRSGFRAAVDRLLPEQRAGQTLLHLLLEELPVATLISGYASLYRQPAVASRNAPVLPADICAGWHHDGLMMRAINETGQIPVPVGPATTALDADDADGWHDMVPLERGAMRRRRMVDVTWGDPVVVGAMFRDTHVEPDGAETVLHEYRVEATVDPARAEILTCVAEPRVLPWPECPAAAASAERLVGVRPSEVRSVVREDFRGITTCTHLNDLLRSLGDVESLMQALRAQLPV
jgi:hypothetical protein